MVNKCKVCKKKLKLMEVIPGKCAYCKKLFCLYHVAAFGKKPAAFGHCCKKFNVYKCSVEAKLTKENPGGGEPAKVAIL